MTKLLATDGEGERLDRFELIAELASGGMATVFLARLSGVAGFQRLVAIKRLHPHLAREPEFIEMFLDEARIAARIHHPNVVPIQEVGESDRGYYLVMDYIEGDTLARVLAKALKAGTTVPYGVTIRILLDVLAGLHAAHEMKDDHGVPLDIVHRDVSPQNILVGVDGVARVVDFGVARAASRLSTTRSGQLKGKLAYMAPEQARGGVVDRRADLFACGIVLWEALATKRLFKGEGEAETLNRVLYDPILPPSSVRGEVPRPLEDVCMKALARDPAERFATAQELGDALEKAARALSHVGSVRDVSQCLEDVMGVDLSQQRDAVRGWLARSEPSHERSRPALDSVTRVEVGTSTAPEKVSSVSSAVIQVDDPVATRAIAPDASVPERARSPRVAIALVVAAVLTGVLAWKANLGGGPSVQAGPSPGASLPAGVGREAASALLPEPAASGAPGTPAAAVADASPAVPSGAPAEPLDAATRPPGVRPPPPPRPVPSGRPATASPTTSASGVPDDLSHNPYR